jgi:hypothetical protein
MMEFTCANCDGPGFLPRKPSGTWSCAECALAASRATELACDAAKAAKREAEREAQAARIAKQDARRAAKVAASLKDAAAKAARRAHSKKSRAQWALEYYRERRRSDPMFNLSHRVRGRLAVALKQAGYRKSSMTHQTLGCDWPTLNHLEAQFLPGMSWENRGAWEIDHRTPLA